jgi:hypothetical protein
MARLSPKRRSLEYVLGGDSIPGDEEKLEKVYDPGSSGASVVRIHQCRLPFTS